MKKLLITAIIIAVAIPAFSQEKEYATKGVWELGGSAAYLSDTIKYDDGLIEKEKTTLLSFAPEVGYFLADNISLGLMLNYTNSKYKKERGGVRYTFRYKTTELYLTPSYIFKQDKMYWYVGALLGMVDGDVISSTKYGVRGGAKVKVGKNGLLNFGLQYLMGSGTYDYGVDEIDFDINKLSFIVGFSLYL